MSKELRVVHAEMLTELAEQHDDVVVLEADLMSSASTKKFVEAHPDKFLQCGIAEANMIGVAAGLSAVGKVPFVHSFGCFATRRCYDQVFVAGGYAKQHINIFGSDAGVAAVTNGGTHMPFEDTGLMRLVPNATVIDVSDEHVLRAAIRFAYANKGVNYIRSSRKDLPLVHKSDNDIEIGKGNVIKEGDALTVFASGICVSDALEAAKVVEEKTGATITVIDMHTIKPLDTELVIEHAKKTGKVITVENHNVIGGLGDAVATDLLSNNVALNHFQRLGIQEQYGQVGSLDFLKDVYGISAEKIAEAYLAAIE